MRVLIISQYFYPEQFRINDLAVGLEVRGHTITVLTGMPNYPGGRYFPGYSWRGPWSERYRGCTLWRVPLVPRGSKRWQLALNYLSFAVLASVVIPFLPKKSFDAIFVYEPSPITVGIPAIFLKYWYRAPVFFWVQDLWPESIAAAENFHSSFVIGIIRWIVRWIYRNCHTILVQSEGFIPRIRDFGVPDARIQYFPNWAEEVYQGASGGNESTIPALPSGFIVMFAGNIGSAQDFGTVLAAAELLKRDEDIHFVIVGDGRMKSWVEAEVERRGLSKTFHLYGQHPVESMPGFFALADVMLVTLKRDLIFSLTIPAKIQSYLACSKAIIASLEGEGARVIQESSSGITVSCEDPPALAHGIRQMSTMGKEQRDAMGRSGYAYYKRSFDRNVLINQLDGILQQAHRANTI